MSEEMKEALAESDGRVGRDTVGEVILCEASGEYVLPDYQPEIRKILSVGATVLPSGKYVGGDRAEFEGRVMHEILYTAEDGAPHALQLPADYSFSAALPCTSPVCVLADSMAEGTVCRLGGPRKLSLRTRLRNTVHFLCEESVAPEIRGMGSAEDAASLEKLLCDFPSFSMLAGDSGEFSLSDTVRLENSAEGTRVVRTAGNLLVSECRIREDGCLLRGEAWVRALLAEEEGTPYTVRTKIPFEQFIPLDGNLTGAEASAYGRIGSVTASLARGEEGAPGHLVFDVAGELEVALALPLLARPTLDLYSTAYEMTCRHRTLSASRLLGCTMGNYTVSGKCAQSECEAENAIAVVDADGRLEISSVTVEHGRATVGGNLLAQVIFSCSTEADGMPPLQSAEIAIPFRIETDLRISPESRPRFDCHGELIAVRGRIEQNALSADCEIALTLRASEGVEMQILAEAEPDHATEEETCDEHLTVCYPKEEDTLWRVASRYRCSRAALVRENGLGEEAIAISHLPASLDGVHHLIISK